MSSENVKAYTCRARKTVTGRQQPSRSSPVQEQAGRPCVIEEGGLGYFHDTRPPKRQWIDLYAIPFGHGAHLLGWFEAADFKVEDVVDPAPDAGS